MLSALSTALFANHSQIINTTHSDKQTDRSGAQRQRDRTDNTSETPIATTRMSSASKHNQYERESDSSSSGDELVKKGATSKAGYAIASKRTSTTITPKTTRRPTSRKDHEGSNRNNQGGGHSIRHHDHDDVSGDESYSSSDDTGSDKKPRKRRDDYSDDDSQPEKKRVKYLRKIYSNIVADKHTVKLYNDFRKAILCGEDLGYKLDDAKDHIEELERKIAVLRKMKSGKSKEDNPQVKQFKSELRAFIRYNLGRKIKFLPDHYQMWSERPKTVCSLVCKAIHWAPGITSDDKITIWSNILAPNLKKLLTEYKNKIHQPMRKSFEGESIQFIFSFSPMIIIVMFSIL